MLLLILFLSGLAIHVQAPPPRFEDYPAEQGWKGPAATVRLATHSERMFRTRLTEAAQKPPDFAGHYRFAGWGCGSNCGAGAIVDLTTGVVYQPPLATKGEGWEHWISCTAIFGDQPYEYRLTSRLMIVRCGVGTPDIHYLLWEGSGFRELLHTRK